MSTHDETAKQALSIAGAMCGNCGDEPGDRKCPDCERCLERYVEALRNAGWAPRAEILSNAADRFDRETDEDEILRGSDPGAALRGWAAESSPSPAAGDKETEALCRCGHGRAYHDAKYSDPQCRLCPGDEERSWRHPYTPATDAT